MAVARWLALVVLVIAVAIALGIGIVQLSPVPRSPRLPPWLRGVGAALALGSVALGAWTFRHHPARVMARVTAKTIEIAQRRLDPSESVVERLITTGPYRHVRNPTYLAVLLLLVGLGLALPDLGLVVAGALLLVWWNALIIPAEEKELKARFGAEYEAYRARTGRFVPRPR